MLVILIHSLIGMFDFGAKHSVTASGVLKLCEQVSTLEDLNLENAVVLTSAILLKDLKFRFYATTCRTLCTFSVRLPSLPRTYGAYIAIEV